MIRLSKLSRDYFSRKGTFVVWVASAEKGLLAAGDSASVGKFWPGERGFELKASEDDWANSAVERRSVLGDVTVVNA